MEKRRNLKENIEKDICVERIFLTKVLCFFFFYKWTFRLKRRLLKSEMQNNIGTLSFRQLLFWQILWNISLASPIHILNKIIVVYFACYLAVISSDTLQCFALFVVFFYVLSYISILIYLFPYLSPKYFFLSTMHFSFFLLNI